MDKWKIMLIVTFILFSTIIILGLIFIRIIKNDSNLEALKPVSEENYDPLMQID